MPAPQKDFWITPILYWPIYWLVTILFRLFYSLRFVHRDRMIEDGPAILACNHVSYLDPPLVGITSRKKVYFLARESLLDWPVLGWLIQRLNVVPVDLEKSGFRALKRLITLVKGGKRVVVFPEGARSYDGKLQPAQGGIGMVVAKTGAPVVPMRIFGAHEALPRGSGRLRRSKISVVVGEPLRFDLDKMTGDLREKYQAISDQIMEQIGALKLEQ